MLRSIRNKKKISVLGILFSTLKCEIVVLSIIIMFYSVLQFVSAYFFSVIVDLFDIHNTAPSKDTIKELGIYLALLVVVLFTCAFLYSYTNFQTNRLSFLIRSNLIILVFNKVLKRNNLNPSEHNQGKVINYIQVDSMKVEQLLFNGISMLQLFITLTLGSVYIWGLLNTALLAMYFSFAISSVIIYYIYKYRMGALATLLQRKDDKMNFLKNLLDNLGYVKMRALENFYHYRLFLFREKEMKQLLVFAYICAIFVFVVWFTRSLALLSVLFYKSFIDPTNFGYNKIAAFMRVFDLIRGVLMMLPYNMSRLVDTMVSIRRIQNFLNSEDKDDSWIHKITARPQNQVRETSELGEIAGKTNGFALELKNGNFEWALYEDEEDEDGKKQGSKKGSLGDSEASTDAEDLNLSTEAPSRMGLLSNVGTTTMEIKGNPCSFALHNIDIKVPKGSLVFIIGKVGSGKSSLLYSILGEMGLPDARGWKERPELIMRGSVALLSETPWLMPKTILENIVMDDPLDMERVMKSIRLAQFDHDLKLMPDGLDTVIGEDGKTLSGGQRTRLALTRCIYKE